MRHFFGQFHTFYRLHEICIGHMSLLWRKQHIIHQNYRIRAYLNGCVVWNPINVSLCVKVKLFICGINTPKSYHIIKRLFLCYRKTKIYLKIVSKANEFSWILGLLEHIATEQLSHKQIQARTHTLITSNKYSIFSL